MYIFGREPLEHQLSQVPGLEDVFYSDGHRSFNTLLYYFSTFMQRERVKVWMTIYSVHSDSLVLQRENVPR